LELLLRRRAVPVGFLLTLAMRDLFLSLRPPCLLDVVVAGVSEDAAEALTFGGQPLDLPTPLLSKWVA
jgi:hypothetical protein